MVTPTLLSPYTHMIEETNKEETLRGKEPTLKDMVERMEELGTHLEGKGDGGVKWGRVDG